MKIKPMHIGGIAFGLVIFGLSFLFIKSNLNLFVFLIGLALGVIVLPFVIQVVLEAKRHQEMSEMFLEFSRNLAESVKTGTPISKSIINLRNRNYGPLSPHISKLANQISIGIPVSKSLENFAYEVDNPIITRAVNLIREAEKAGGEIEAILESSARSIAEIEKLRKERKAVISSLVVQGYIIFFIFIVIMLIMEFKIMPLTQNLSQFNLDLGSIDPTKLAEYQLPGEAAQVELEMFSPFLSLLLVQGFFAGLIIGKLTEGSIKDGIKHSFILAMSAFLISAGAKLFF
ncbi:MAG: type II secretion system F family protein [Nanoarchaeota archaeon]|nr:type II secretion system F family protein [Nanoarchaeota archaeon]